MSQLFESLAAEFARYAQDHVLRYWDELNEGERDRLLTQLRSIDLGQLERLIKNEDPTVDLAAMAARAQSPPAVRSDGIGATWPVSEAVQRGEAILNAGRVAVLIVAGGQGTRLGFDHPKGMFAIGPVSGRTLFEFFADMILGTQRRYGKAIPLFLMTSPATHAETLRYFEDHHYLGLDKEQVHLFCQGTMPAVDSMSGKLLLESRDSLALSPDGHGGTVAALHNSGALATMRQQGITQLFYAQVDNPLVRLCDPTLLGHHLMAGSEMTTLVVRKRFATEKVGNVVLVDGRVQIIEYSDLPQSAAEQVDEDGNLRLWAGNIAVHILDVAFLERMAQQPGQLPFHRALKKVSHLDDFGNLIEPANPNAIKFERFIFDLLPHAENAFVVEGIASEIFAPVKNANGAPSDTPDAARRQICDLHRGWLRAAGLTIGDDVPVEIHPLVALDAAETCAAVVDGRLPPVGSEVVAATYFAPPH